MNARLATFGSLVFCLTAVAAGASQLALEFSRVSAGGSASSSETFQLNGTVGQPEAGPLMAGGSYTLLPGFLSATLNPSTNVAPSVAFSREALAYVHDGSMQILTNFAAFSPGGPHEQGQTLLGYTVLNDLPSAFASVPALSSDGTLTFTPARRGKGWITVTVIVQDSGGSSNGGADKTTNHFTISLTPRNAAPVIQFSEAELVVLEDSGARSFSGFVQFDPGASDESDQVPVAYTVTSDNPSLFSASPVLSLNGMLAFTTAANASGDARVTVVVQDNGGTASGGVDRSTNSFRVSVIPVNDPPSIQFIAGNVTVLEDSGMRTITDFVLFYPGPEEIAQTLVGYTLSTDNPALFSIPPRLDSNGTLTFIPARDAYGRAHVTVIAQDSGGTANGGMDQAVSSFVINVTPLNDPPRIQLTTNQLSVLEDSGRYIGTRFAQFDSGPLEDVQNSLGYTVSHDNPALFAEAPTLSSDGTLRFSPAVNATGEALVTARARDDGGTADGGLDESVVTFRISVLPVNEPPSVRFATNKLLVLKNASISLQGFAEFAPGPTNEASQTLMSYTVSSDGPVLFRVLPQIDMDGVLAFQTAPAARGVTTVSVTTRDSGGRANGGTDKSISTFVIVVPALAIDPIAGDDVVNATEIGAALALSGRSELLGHDHEVRIILNERAYSARVLANRWSVLIPIRDAIELSEGRSYSISAQAFDQGDRLVALARREFKIDLSAPVTTLSPIAVDDVLNASESLSDLIISGVLIDVEIGSSVIVNLNQTSYTTVPSGHQWQVRIPSRDLQALGDDATHRVSVHARDRVGNSSPPVFRDLRVDQTPPSITSIAGPASGAYRAGDGIIFSVRFTEPVSVEISQGTPLLAFQLGSADRTAAYFGQSGTEQLSFRYSVSAGDNFDFPISVQGNLEAARGIVRDAAGNDAALGMPSTIFGNVVIDTTPPAASISAPNINAVQGTVEYSITFADLHLDTASVNPTGISLARQGSANGTMSLTGGPEVWKVVLSNITGIGVLNIAVDSEAVRDKAGNQVVLQAADPGVAVNTGVVLDGYTEGATVFFDANHNKSPDPTEPRAATDRNGRFTIILPLWKYDVNQDQSLAPAEGLLGAIGGIDIANGVPLKVPILGVFGSAVLSPLTTLMATALLEAPDLGIADIQSRIRTHMRLPSEIDLLQFDPVQGLRGDDPAAAAVVLTSGAKVQDLLVQVAALLASASGMTLDAIAPSVIESLSTHVLMQPSDFSQAETVLSVMRAAAERVGVSLQGSLEQAAAQLIAGNNAAKDSAVLSSENPAGTALAVAGLQSTAQLFSVEALAAAAVPGLAQSLVHEIFSEALIAGTNSWPADVLSGDDARPGEFNFFSPVSLPSAAHGGAFRITIARSEGTFGAGRVGLLIGTSPDPIVVDFAHREFLKTIDVTSAIQNDPELADSAEVSARLAMVPGPVESNIGQANTANLILTPVPVILVQPSDLEILAGSSASFSADVKGAAPLRYQWLKSGIAIAGATNILLSLEKVSTHDSGSYSLEVSNTYGLVRTQAGTLTVVDPVFRFESIRIRPDGHVELSLHAPALRVILQHSVDLTNWEDVTTVNPSSAVETVIVPSSPGASVRFFRGTIHR